jgi:hypothetical protein
MELQHCTEPLLQTEPAWGAAKAAATRRATIEIRASIVVDGRKGQFESSRVLSADVRQRRGASFYPLRVPRPSRVAVQPCKGRGRNEWSMLVAPLSPRAPASSDACAQGKKANASPDLPRVAWKTTLVYHHRLIR